jgi:cytosine deaminase
MSESDPGFLAAVEEARQGFAEGGVPIGRYIIPQP